MTEVIVREVNSFMSRSGIKNSHIYYSVAYLNRIASMVAHKDEKVRVMLLRIYFSLFKKILKTETEQIGEKVEEQKPQFKKDRTKSKRDNTMASKKQASAS